MVYIESFLHTSDKECFICSAAVSSEPKIDLVLERTEHAVVLMNLYPYNPGHLLVAPRRHLGEFSALNDVEVLELIRSVDKWISVTRKALGPTGFNIGVNLGDVAGAGLPDHLHLHLVPRWEGDTNFMPVTASIKVIPELLATTYDKLANASRSSG